MLDSGKVVLFHVSVETRPALYPLPLACGWKAMVLLEVDGLDP
jgi:hypothetical protein